MIEPLAPILSDEEVEPTYLEYLNGWRTRRNLQPSNNMRVMGNAPDVAVEARRFFDAMMMQVSISAELRFLIRYVVSNTNQCRYCSAHQLRFLRRNDVSVEKIHALQDFENSNLFSEKEIAALSYAKALVENAAAVPYGIYDGMIKWFTPKERVEINLIVGSMNMMNIFNDGMRVPLEEDSIRELEQ